MLLIHRRLPLRMSGIIDDISSKNDPAEAGYVRDAQARGVQCLMISPRQGASSVQKRALTCCGVSFSSLVTSTSLAAGVIFHSLG